MPTVTLTQAITDFLAQVQSALGIDHIDNTSDADKPVSTAQQQALDDKADLAGADFTGDISAPNLSGSNTGDQDLSTYATLTQLADKIDSSEKGVTVATLESGVVPSAQLPSYVDDVLEYANFAVFPTTGASGKIYIAIDTETQYRWSGSVYVELVASPGTTDNVPEGTTNKYFTDVRAAAAAPVQSVAGKTGTVTLAKGDVGLGNVDNTSDANKPVSTAQQTALNAKVDLAAPSAGFVGATAAGNYGHRTPTQVTAALDVMVGDSGSGGTKGLVPAPAAGDAAAGKFLKADGTYAAPAAAAGLGWTLAGTWTYSGTAVSNVDFTGLNGNEFLVYVKSLTMTSATNGVIRGQFSDDNGSTWYSSSTNYAAISAASGSESAVVGVTVNGSGSAANRTNLWHVLNAKYAGDRAVVVYGATNFTMFRGSTSPINGIRIASANGGTSQINGGTIEVYYR